MSELGDGGQAQGEVGKLPRARPAGVVLGYARPVHVGPIRVPVPRLSRGAAGVDIVLLGGLFIGLQFAQQTVLFLFLGDAPEEEYRRWAPGAIVGAGVVLAMVVMAVGWRRGQSLAAVGLTGRRWPLDAAIGVLGALGVIVLTVVGSIYVQVHLPYLVPLLEEPQKQINEALPPMSLGTIVMLTAVVAFYEELLFRGFMLPRLRVLTGSWWSAILLGAALFGVLHIYEGPIAVVLVMGLATLLSVLFVWRGSLLAPMVTHFLFNTVQLGALQFLNRAG